MTKPSPLAQISIRNGLIAALLSASIILVLYFWTDTHPLLINPFLDFRIVLFSIFIFLSLKEFKDRFTNGILYFWQGMIGSYIFLLTFAGACSLFILIFSYFDPAFVSEHTAQSLALLRQNKEFIDRVGKEEFERNFANSPPTNGLRLSLVYFLVSLLIGFFVSIILSVIARRQPKI